ncbi:MAG: OmpP1/FadL family transporter, partial [Cyclobacteriaceae bacterium]
MISTKKLLFATSFFLLSAGFSLAQTSYFEDALRFSKYYSTGSARILGLGGTQISLGGDISNIHSNPAGLGFFRKSEFSLSPSYSIAQSQTTFLGQLQNDRTPNFSLPNLSLALSSPKGPLEAGSFRGGTFGISFNRIANFNNQFGHFSTQNNQSSLLDFYISQYNAFGEPPLGATDGLVLDIELVQGNETDGFFRDPLYAIGQPLSDEIIITEGGISQTSISYGANFDNKLFIGGGIGLQSVNFFQNRIFGEEFRDSDGIRSLIYSIEDNTQINGFGANINLGLIYKPIETINLGLNFKSPTWHRLNKEVDANIIGEFYDLNGQLEFSEREFSNIELSTNSLRTPIFVSGGATYFFGKNGFISADIDYIDYSQNRINSRDFDPTIDNFEISNSLGQTINYRIGGEYRLNFWRLRAGYAFYGDPTID